MRTIAREMRLRSGTVVLHGWLVRVVMLSRPMQVNLTCGVRENLLNRPVDLGAIIGDY